MAAWADLPSKAADLTLTTVQPCYGSAGTTLSVNIRLTNAGLSVIGGQFFLRYDQSVLQFHDIAPGEAPFVNEIYEIVPGDGGPGTIDYAIGTVPGGLGTSLDSTMAVIHFTALTEFCGLSGFVSFRQHNPPTRLSDDTGGDVSVTVANLVCPGETCDDGNACTANDVCSNGKCGGVPVDCSDNNICTNDLCNPTTGCYHVNNTISCDDGNICTTNDACTGGTCAGTTMNCDDDNPCTDDFCNPETECGCYHVNNTRPCDDGNICTTSDICSGGICVGGPLLGCNLGTVCTTGTCRPDTGCTYAYNSVTCDDGNACTAYDVCSNGICSGVPVDCDDNNACTDDLCNPLTGCYHVNNTARCNDHHSCKINDVCTGGVCSGVSSSPTCVECIADGQCNDGNNCTTDTCFHGICFYTPNSNSCDDGNACTTNDTCASGVCIGGAALDCDDGSICTDDSCNPSSGCVHVVNSDPCDSGNACTTYDTCFGGVCLGGPPINCDDGNACTDDFCNPASGCLHINNSAPCNDGCECTTNDVCSGGLCVGGPPPDCDDGNPCTDDSCDVTLGCYHIFNTNPCDDGNDCTNNDICTFGACRGTLFCGLSTPFPDPNGPDKVRYLSFQIQGSQSGPSETALQVKLVSLMHPNPLGLSQFPPPDFIALEGQVRYVGVPLDCTETEVLPATFKCAPLQCTPHYMDWGDALGGRSLHVTSQEVVPSSTYEVRQLAASCQGDEGTCTAISDPLTIHTQRWGDVAAPFQAPFPAPLTQPNITDVAACVDKFKAVPAAIIVARADVNPAVPNGRVDIADVANIVDAFKNLAYPFPGPTACP
ncbi:MAG: hypothetical protein HY287_13160 [Planctomycetes bacterium]|nr:hypothetical protein [Planctomycetota bacterium]MBI3835271.1 hypothetical protein [Planctomycetota bacterium]